MTDEIKALIGTKISKEDQERISALLPEDMHIPGYDGILKYRNGKHPNTLKALIDHSDSFPKGTSGFAGYHHPGKSLQDAYKKLLDSKYKETKDTNAKRLSKMHLDMIDLAYEKKNPALFSRLLVDFRVNAGEMPVQEQQISSISAEYTKIIVEYEALPLEVKREYAIQTLKALAAPDKPDRIEPGREEIL